MNTLATRQEALLDALLQPRPPQAGAPWDATGLGIYRANAHAHAERALADAYPVVHALLGDETFHALARALWHQQPPARGDLGEWGAALADWMVAEPDLATLPYLGDVARTEWALHQAARAPEVPGDPASFTHLQDYDLDGLHPRLAAGSWVLASHWPVLSIIDAHLHGAPGFDAVARRLRDGVREAVRVWRQGGRVRACAIDTTTAHFETLLLCGHSLGQALDQVPLDIENWLTDAVRSGCLLGLNTLPAARPHSTSNDATGDAP